MMARLRLIRIAGLFVAALTATAGQALAAAPTVTGISPNSGSVSGGGTADITGTNLTNVTSVTIGGNNATVVSPSVACQLANVTLAGSCLTVAIPAATSSSFPAPTVTASSSNPNPNHGPTGGGTSVTITGTNFLGFADVVVTTTGGSAGTGNKLYTYTGVVSGVSIGGTAATNVTVGGVSIPRQSRGL